MAKKGLLWEITGNGKEKPSYVFGTMHVKDQRVFDRLEVVKTKIEACNSFATEFRLDEVDMQMMALNTQLPKGSILPDYLTIDQNLILNTFLQEKIGLTIAQVQHQKPLLISNLISTSFFNQEQQLSLDETLFSFAKSNQKVLKGLETFEEQMQVLNDIKIEQQVKYLFEIVNGFDEHETEIATLTKLYLDGDIKALQKMAKQSTKELQEILLDRRNKIMANRIAIYVMQETLFAAIGAGHLAGKGGVLKRLKALGFKVQPVEL